MVYDRHPCTPCTHPTTPRHVLAPLPHPWHTPLYTLTLIAPPPPLYSLLTQHARHIPACPTHPAHPPYASAPATPLPTPHHTKRTRHLPLCTQHTRHIPACPTHPVCPPYASAPSTPLPTPHHTSSCPSTPATPMAHTSLHAHTHRTPTTTLLPAHPAHPAHSPTCVIACTQRTLHASAHTPPHQAHPPRLCPHPTTPRHVLAPLPHPWHTPLYTLTLIAPPPYPRMPYAPGVSAIRQRTRHLPLCTQRTRHASAHTPPRLVMS